MEETEKISRGGQKRDTASIIYKSRRLWGMDHGLGTDRTVRRSPKVTEKMVQFDRSHVTLYQSSTATISLSRANFKTN